MLDLGPAADGLATNADERGHRGATPLGAKSRKRLRLESAPNRGGCHKVGGDDVALPAAPMNANFRQRGSSTRLP